MMSMHQLLDEFSQTNPTEMPEGFKKVSVVLTDTEYDRLRMVAAVTGEGTMSAAIRRAMKWKETPYGLKAKLVHLLEDRKQEATDGLG